MKYATAVHVIRIRGASDVRPGTVFEIAEIDEFRRLESALAIREATPDEIKAYQDAKTAGEIAARKVEGRGIKPDEDNDTAKKIKNGKASAPSQPATTKAAESGDTSKVGESKTSSTSTAPAGTSADDDI